MLHNLVSGLTIIFHGADIAYLFGGALLGMVIGVIPGLGGAVVLSILLSFVYHIDLTGTVCLFLGSQGGSFYSASVTSILLNTPAHPEAFAVTFDGFPMARRGEAGRALGLSAASTCVGGIIGCAVLVAFVPLLNELPGVFHPPEYVALVTLAMLLVGTLGTDSIGQAVAAAGAGLLVSCIGAAAVGNQDRFTFGAIGLQSGISLVALALGCFAIPQMAMIFGTGTTMAHQDMAGREIGPSTQVVLERGIRRQLISGVLETFRHWGVLLQGGLTGAVTGIVPGIGAFAANFLSYGLAQQVSGKKDAFGTGIPEGIIAPEGASLAKEAGSMIPVLGLGIPGGVGGALFIAALTIKGVRTGFGFASTYPTLPYEIAWVIACAGVIGTVAGLIFGPWLMKVTKVPGPIIVPFILVFSAIGPFLVDTLFFSTIEVLVFGIIGIGFRRLRYPLAAFILGMVLGPILETNIYLTRNAFPGVSFLWKRPLADGIALLAVLVFVLKVKQTRATRRQQRLLAAEAPEEVVPTATPYPLLAVILDVFLICSATFFFVYAVTNYQFHTSAMPMIAGGLVILPTTYKLRGDVSALLARHRSRRAEVEVSGATVVLAMAGIGSAAGESSAELADGGAHPTLLDAMGPVPMVTPDDFPVIHDKSWGWHGQYTRELYTYIWLAGLLAVCYLFTFDVGVPVFMAVYGMIATRRFIRTIWGRLVFSVFSAAVMWAITYEAIAALHIPLLAKIHL